jgi:hypothetical protein
MVSLEKAIEKSKEFAHKYIEEDTLKNLRVEEVELTENERYWVITLGWDGARVQLTPFATAAGFPQSISRRYKNFYVDVDSGDVKKMKNFE